MSHGSTGGKNTGLSKSLVMALVMLLSPSMDNQPLNFSAAWYPLDISSMNHLQLDLLSILSRSVTKYFWVSFRVRFNQGKGWDFYNYKFTKS